MFSSLLAIPSTLVVLLLYYMFSVVFPRSGGEYVYVGRTLHPSLGFTVNAVMTLCYVSVGAVEATWVSTFTFGPMFSLLNLEGWTSVSPIATFFSVPINQLAIGVLMVVLFNLLYLFGNRVAFATKKVLFVITGIGMVIYIAAMVSMSNSSFVANWNSVSSFSYNQVISTASTAGLYSTSVIFPVSTVAIAIIYADLAVNGGQMSAYAGGEVRNPQRNQLIGMVGSAAVFFALMFVVIATAYSTMGYNFVTSISYLAVNGNANYVLPAPLPALWVVVSYVMRSPIFTIVMAIGFLASTIGNIMVITFEATRIVFAWSFDAVIPTKFSDVNERFHTPHYALLLIVVVETLFVYLTLFTAFSAFLTYEVPCIFTVVTVVGIAAVALPYEKRWKDLFSSCPRIITRKVAGVPLMVIVGVLAIVDGIVIAYVSTAPQISGPFTPEYLYMAVGFFVCGFAAYWASHLIQKRRGIPVDLMQRAIPPE